MERITNRKTAAATAASTDASASVGVGMVSSSAPSLPALVASGGNKMNSIILSSSTGNGKMSEKNSNHNSASGNNRVGVGGGEVSYGKVNDDDSNLKNDASTRPRPRNHSYLGGCMILSRFQWLFSMRFLVLLILCLQNSLFTVLRRFSQGVLHEKYSKYEALLLAEIIKMLVSARMIHGELRAANNNINNSLNNNSVHSQSASGGGEGDATTSSTPSSTESFWNRLIYLIGSSRKMVVLASIYGTMNILSFFSLLNIGAGMFTIFSQCKILSTAAFSTIILKRQYSWTKWRALTSLMLGVVLFSEPIWGNSSSGGGGEAGDDVGEADISTSSSLSQLAQNNNPQARPLLGMCTQAIEVTLSGFAAIYFEKVIKVDPLHHTIWERNFQLALASIPVHAVFIIYNGGGSAGFGGGWSWTAVCVSLLGAAGGLLVALSIKYGDAILKTLATSGSIVISSVLDHFLLGGPLSPFMTIAASQVIISICNYTFDASPPLPDTPGSPPGDKAEQLQPIEKQEAATKANLTFSSTNEGKDLDEEFSALLQNESGSAESVGSTARGPPVYVV
jgi:solute carrier family 35 (UDP-sugar transporter), member A1/2/3